MLLSQSNCYSVMLYQVWLEWYHRISQMLLTLEQEIRTITFYRRTINFNREWI